MAGRQGGRVVATGVAIMAITSADGRANGEFDRGILLNSGSPEAGAPSAPGARAPTGMRTEAKSDQDALQVDATPETPDAKIVERFIPVSRFEILDRMTRPQLWGAQEIGDVKRFYRYLAAWRHISYNERLVRLEEDYLPFSPETDLIRIGQYRPEDRVVMRRDLIRHLRRLLQQANFTEMPLTELKGLFAGGKTEYGLDLAVDLEEYEECLVFRRGISTRTREKRDMKSGYYKTRTIEFPVYQRLLVLLKLKPFDQRVREVAAKQRIDVKKAKKIVTKNRKMMPPGLSADHVYIKMFKDIPHSDIEMMFPNTVVKFRNSTSSISARPPAGQPSPASLLRPARSRRSPFRRWAR